MTGRLSRRSAYWLAGYVLLVLMMSTTVPVPLYEIHRRELAFSTGVLTLVFAAYMFLVVPALLVFGQVADVVGRRRVILLGLGVAVLGSVVFALAHSVGWLLAARAAHGVAVGAGSGAATAALIELRGTRSRDAAALLASAAVAGGGALGPVTAGLLAEYARWPTALPFVLHAALLIPALVGAWAMPETLESRRPLRAVRLRRPSVPAAILGAFAIGAGAGFVTWAAGSLFTSLVPTFATLLLGIDNVALGGGVVTAMLTTSTAAQILLRSAPVRPTLVAGLLLLAAGLGAIVLSVPLRSGWLLLASALLAGAGFGLALRSSLALVSEIAPPARRADVTSTYYVVSFLGIGPPVLLVGFGAAWVGLFAAVAVFAAALGALALWLVVLAVRRLPALRARAS